MSTKFYNAWITKQTPLRILTEAKKMKTAILSCYRNQRRDAMRAMLEREGANAPTVVAKTITNIAFWILSGQNAQPFTPTCSIVVYPHPTKKKKPALVVQLFGFDKEIGEHFVKRIRGKDYHYQNQVDFDESVSEKQIAERKRAWDKMCDSGTPSQEGFYFDIVTNEEALKIVFAELCRAFPPPTQPNQDGRPWDEWGPDCYGTYRAADVQRALRQSRRHFDRKMQEIMEERLKPFDAADLSLQSAAL